MNLNQHIQFVRDDDDGLPSGQFPPYSDEWLKPHWTLAQTIGWIYGRTPPWGRRFAPDYLEQKGLRSLGPLSPNDAISIIWQATSEDEDQQINLLEHLRRELYGRLASAELTASGIAPGQDVPEPLPQLIWRGDVIDGLDWHGGLHDDIGVYDRSGEKLSRVAYAAVRVLREDVLRIWPVNAPEARKLIAAVTSCRKSLVLMMTASPNVTRSKADVRPEYPNVSERGFNMAWTAAAVEANAPAWSAPGAKPKAR